MPNGVAGTSKLAYSTTHDVVEVEEEVFFNSTAAPRHETPSSLLHSTQSRGRYIRATEVKRPRASRLAILDFTPTCCADMPVYVV